MAQKKVLLIDDDPDTRTYLSTILLRGGFLTVLAEDGREGWERILEDRPDLILLDMMMPHTSGFELLKDLKTHPEYGSIPTYVISGMGQLTGVDMQKHLIEVSGSPIGPDGYLEKPIKPEILLRTVKKAFSE